MKNTRKSDSKQCTPLITDGFPLNPVQCWASSSGKSSITDRRT